MRKKPKNGIYLYEIQELYNLSYGVAYNRFKECKMDLNYNCREFHIYDINKVKDKNNEKANK